MKVLKTTKLTAFDVDETLVLFNNLSPHDGPKEDTVYINRVAFIKHMPHIAQLKSHKARGHTVLVWSRGGHDWAVSVIKALGLEDYVDFVVDKPHWMYDDDQMWPEWIYYDNQLSIKENT